MQAFAFEFYVLSLLFISKFQTVANDVAADKASDSVTPEQTTQHGEKPDKQTTERFKFKGKFSPMEHYKKLFSEQRAMQLNAVKSMQKFGSQEAKFKLVGVMLHQLFKNLQDSSQNLTAWGYTPGDEFPENKTVRETVSKVLENTALFGDMLLRMPQAVHEFYDKNRDWHLLMRWAFTFSNESGVFEGPHETMLNLMGQEAGLIPKSPNYVNPFLAAQEEEGREKIPVSVVSKKAKEKKQKKIAKGPRMSRTEL
ncbi:coiled-coil domain-containing protein 134-like [Littorina saxatilis]|uniref:Coiled-coil domain-containing protein 134 n=1 Tax=Littorina saxatilis TaxID=31220 RepID=A0AAN9G7J8_9CAEN